MTTSPKQIGKLYRLKGAKDTIVRILNFDDNMYPLCQIFGRSIHSKFEYKQEVKIFIRTISNIEVEEVSYA